jgi:DNA-binding NarL/FixJ family response regulator
MPNYDGWQFLQDLKHDARTRHIPVVAISSYVQRSLRERAGRDGFAAFFPKPCLPDELADALRHVLDGKVHAHVPRDSGTKRCPQCRRNTLMLRRHYPVLSATAALTRTGTDPHDRPDRLRYESAWVCQNPRCDYWEAVGEE